MRWAILGVIGAALATTAVYGQIQNTATLNAGTLRPVASFSGIADQNERSRALFNEIGKVVTNPRCMNCHPAGDRPLQGNDSHLHVPPIARGEAGLGARFNFNGQTTFLGTQSFPPLSGEAWVGAVARYDGVDLGPVHAGLAMTAGFSAVTGLIGSEAVRASTHPFDRFGTGGKLLYYLGPEIDLSMPEVDGLTVLREIKADPRLQRVPVILQTAAGNAVQVGEGLAAGAHYYLVKPFDRAQLLPIVHGAVSTYQTMREQRRRLLEANPLGLIETGRFRFRTLVEARELAAWLARASRSPMRVPPPGREYADRPSSAARAEAYQYAWIIRSATAPGGSTVS